MAYQIRKPNSMDNLLKSMIDSVYDNDQEALETNMDVISDKGAKIDSTQIENPEHILKIVTSLISKLAILRDSVKIRKYDFAVKILNNFSNGLGKLLISALTSSWCEENPEYGMLKHVYEHFMDAFPEIIQKQHKASGKMLIHHVTAVKTILKKYPPSALVADNLGFLPLHWAMQNDEPTLGMVDDLIKANPEGVKGRDKNGFIPLHWAANKHFNNFQLINELVRHYPDGAGVQGVTGRLPLHYALNNSNPDIEVIKLLHTTYPEGVKVTCKSGFLPIDILLLHPQKDIEVFRYLLDAYPDCIRHRDNNGQYLLHKVIDLSPASAPLFDLIFSNFDEAVKIPDNEGYYPLHIALDNPEPNLHIVNQLLQVYPQAAKQQTVDSFFPLHFAISTNKRPSPEIVQRLCEIYHGAVEYLVVDQVPVDRTADPFQWKGRWKEIKWTPLSRAVERKLHDIVPILREASLELNRTDNGWKYSADERKGDFFLPSIYSSNSKAENIYHDKFDALRYELLRDVDMCDYQSLAGSDDAMSFMSYRDLQSLPQGSMLKTSSFESLHSKDAISPIRGWNSARPPSNNASIFKSGHEYNSYTDPFQDDNLSQLTTLLTKEARTNETASAERCNTSLDRIITGLIETPTKASQRQI